MVNLKRPTILGLMILIAYLAVGLTAIRSDDKIWAAIVMYLTVFLLCSATLLAIHRRTAWARIRDLRLGGFPLFNPNEPDRWPGSISMILASYVVTFFRNPNVSNNSLRLILSIASVVMGCLVPSWEGALDTRAIPEVRMRRLPTPVAASDNRSLLCKRVLCHLCRSYGRSPCHLSSKKPRHLPGNLTVMSGRAGFERTGYWKARSNLTAGSSIGWKWSCAEQYNT